METLKHSENPIKDIWKMLLKYSYISNIDRYLSNEGDEELKHTIAGSFVQSSEYFEAFSKVSLNTSPLLLYYGYVNLLFASSSMICKKSAYIKNHGLTISLPENLSKIGDTIINFSNSSEGAYHLYNQIFCGGIDYPQKMTLKDLLSLIPEIKNDFENCYSESSLCIPIEVVKRRVNTIERIHLNELIQDVSSLDIVDFENSYLKPDKTKDYIILRKKLTGMDIGIKSISGQKYLFQYYPQELKKYKFDQLLVFFAGLYALGFLSRYHPEKWYPFIQSDQTGEKGLIDEFLSIAHRKLPNLILNRITEKEIVFSNKKLGVIDTSTEYDPEDVKKIVKEEIKINDRR